MRFDPFFDALDLPGGHFVGPPAMRSILAQTAQKEPKRGAFQPGGGGARGKQPLVLPVEFAGHPMAEGTQAGSRTRLDGELARPFLERRQPAKSASQCLVHERSVEREHQRSEGLRLQLKLLTGACKLAQAGVEIVS